MLKTGLKNFKKFPKGILSVCAFDVAMRKKGQITTTTTPSMRAGAGVRRRMNI